ncbi:hypothetical protein ACLOJK_028572 [Asimina triloba]
MTKDPYCQRDLRNSHGRLAAYDRSWPTLLLGSSAAIADLKLDLRLGKKACYSRSIARCCVGMEVDAGVGAAIAEFRSSMLKKGGELIATAIGSDRR